MFYLSGLEIFCVRHLELCLIIECAGKRQLLCESEDPGEQSGVPWEPSPHSHPTAGMGPLERGRPSSRLQARRKAEKKEQGNLRPVLCSWPCPLAPSTVVSACRYKVTSVLLFRLQASIELSASWPFLPPQVPDSVSVILEVFMGFHLNEREGEGDPPAPPLPLPLLHGHLPSIYHFRASTKY